MVGGSQRRLVRRVLVEPNGYHVLNVGNLGDVAMLQVAVRRLAALWPEAAIEVLTEVPDRLARLCPGTTPVPAEGRNAYLAAPAPGDRLWRRLPGPIPKLARHARYAVRSRTGTPGAATRFVESVRRADLVVVSGGGGTADDFPWETHTVLDVLELGMAAGVPTAMMGQGLGPLHDPTLRRHAAAVLPRVDLIAVRERLASAPLLQSLGVSMDRVVITGDDAIGVVPAFRRERPPEPVIGVNVRVAPYSGVDRGLAAQIGTEVRAAAARHQAVLLPIAISVHRDEADATVTADALGSDTEIEPMDDPHDVVAAIARCRIVVTGSYHAGLFALALGIPAVGLARSPYYVDKFCGLADQFEVGCEVVELTHPDWPVHVGKAVDGLWYDAEELREPLLEAADRQMGQAEAAYRRLRDIVEGR